MCTVAQNTSEHQGSAELLRTPLWRSTRRPEMLHSPVPVGQDRRRGGLGRSYPDGYYVSYVQLSLVYIRNTPRQERGKAKAARQRWGTKSSAAREVAGALSKGRGSALILGRYFTRRPSSAHRLSILGCTKFLLISLLRTSQNSVTANFAEFTFRDCPKILKHVL